MLAACAGAIRDQIHSRIEDSVFQNALDEVVYQYLLHLKYDY